jgi:hypothetical protein
LKRNALRADSDLNECRQGASAKINKRKFKESNPMKNLLKTAMLGLAITAFGAVLVPRASAGCGDPFRGTGKVHVSPQSWEEPGDFGGASLLMASDHDSDVSIVGMWHVLFIAKGNEGPGLPPDGVPVDNALSTWHSDGTELTVSSRVPATGDVCQGVWQQFGRRHYKLNHFGISFDPATDPNNPLGFANIRQNIVLSPDGKTFVGTFLIQQYDQTGNLLVEIKGVLNGSRVGLKTSVSDLL